MSEPFYRREGEGVFAPLKAATGPWDPRFQNGVALGGLMAHVLEAAPAADGLDLARFHIDILKPAPMAPFHLTCATLRDGRRLQVLEAELRVDGDLCARAGATRVRMDESPAAGMGGPPSPPEAFPRAEEMESRSSLRHLLEMRPIHGGLSGIGPGAAWYRFEGQIADDAPITPFVQAAMVSDIGSGLSRIVDWRVHTFANVDISLNLSRAPNGEWVRLEAETVSCGNGRALVNSILSDREGEFARAHQTLFIDRKARSAG